MGALDAAKLIIASRHRSSITTSRFLIEVTVCITDPTTVLSNKAHDFGDDSEFLGEAKITW
ncbi:MAG: hypothetical protein MK188_06500 [Gammaproteobacteria bacterium]|nr:hypothetical protein [Gammaproteobacteria bacterium]